MGKKNSCCSQPRSESQVEWEPVELIKINGKDLGVTNHSDALRWFKIDSKDVKGHKLDSGDTFEYTYSTEPKGLVLIEEIKTESLKAGFYDTPTGTFMEITEEGFKPLKEFD